MHTTTTAFVGKNYHTSNFPLPIISLDVPVMKQACCFFLTPCLPSGVVVTSMDTFSTLPAAVRHFEEPVLKPAVRPFCHLDPPAAVEMIAKQTLLT